MTENQAMLIVAEQVAKENGYIEVSKHIIDASRDWFWGNRAAAQLSGKPIQITACKYILPIFEGEKDESKRRPKIEIDMHWGKPRLGIDLTDVTFCCLTYKDGICSEAQAFGEKGLAFALSIKDRINYLINK